MFGFSKRGERDAECGAALCNGFVEKGTSNFGRHQQAGVNRASGLTENRDVIGIATEFSNVVADPEERKNLIHQSIVARGMAARLAGEFGMSEEAKNAEAIVDGDENNSMVDQGTVFVERAGSSAALVGSAMESRT